MASHRSRLLARLATDPAERRILLRLDELEKRLDELEFTEADEVERGSPEPQHVPSADGHRSLMEAPPSDSEAAAGEDTRAPAAGRDDSAHRFNNRSLARSRIKRDGLKAGTSAPSFRLPRLDGGELTLEELRGKRVLLVFSDPHCGPYQDSRRNLKRFTARTRRLNL